MLLFLYYIYIIYLFIYLYIYNIYTIVSNKPATIPIFYTLHIKTTRDGYTVCMKVSKISSTKTKYIFITTPRKFPSRDPIIRTIAILLTSRSQRDRETTEAMERAGNLRRVEVIS